MKEFQVTFGGKERTLKYASADMKALQRQFGFGAPADFIFGQVLGITVNPPSNTNWDISAQHEFLAKGISRGSGKSFVATHVEEWWDRALAEGVNLKAILWEAVRAAYYAGVVTMESWDIEEKGGGIKALFFAKDLAEVMKIADQEATPSTPSPSTPGVIAAADNV